MRPDKNVDPARVARSLSIHCPYCGHAASAESIAGRSGHRRLYVTCTDIDCNRLRQVVEVNEATGQAVTLEDDAATPGAKPRPMRKPPGRRKADHNKGPCPVEGCTEPRRHSGMCMRHYQRWVSCGKPDVDTWLALGGPAKVAWQQVRTTAAPCEPEPEQIAESAGELRDETDEELEHPGDDDDAQRQRQNKDQPDA